jgi:RimJ/RimL family protein N-acetyltransferase
VTSATLGRFTLRDVNLWDAPELLALFGDAQTVRYMGLRQLRGVAEASALIERYATSPTRWLAVLDDAKFLGIVGMEAQGHQVALTIAFNRTQKARGAGRELSVPFVTWIFTHPNIWRVWAYCHVDNLPVQRVLSRMGAEREGRLRRFEVFPNLSHEPQDVFSYSITR